MAFISTAYQPQVVESGKAEKWSKNTINYANGIRNKQFVMIIPPPNVTGYLHLGHSLMATIQDVLCRRKQQLGYETIWIPGTDHAGIATQVVVEKKLLKEKKCTRHQLGRENFVKEIWAWKDEKENKINRDLKKLGCLLNWDKEYFTMDKKQSVAVTKAFIKLFEENLIERRNSLVNWSCSLQSAISDIEVDSREINGPTIISVPNHNKSVTFGRLYDISYKIKDLDEEIVVSTTRPETLLGDVAVAVNPNDPRYQKYKEHSTMLWHPFRNEHIPLIFDANVEIEFGTGAVKITPAHDKIDFEIAERHNLNTQMSVFTEEGKINSSYEEFSNLPRFEARDKILKDLSNLGLLKGMKDHKMILPMCSRSKDVVEYMLRPQWFLKCQDMAKEAIKAVEIGKIKIHPRNFENEWFKWLQNSKDWCISRQLWWGHQIPAYLAKINDRKIWVAAESEEQAFEKVNSVLTSGKENIKITRDEDVLDTWFSSSLLPFSCFDWPKESFKNFYPLDLMETGHDILFFWVARMVMLGQKLTGDIPFKNILLNGIVCDAHGRKMSKSLGNIVMPDQVINGASFEDMKLEIEKSHNSGILSSDEMKKSVSNFKKIFPKGIPECGTDALRFTLLSHNIKSHFINFDVSECHTNRLFLNKIWQATRYTLQSFEKIKIDSSFMENLKLTSLNLCNMDKWILSRLMNTKEICYQSYDNYNFHLATQAIKTFFYSNFCDTYLETTKSAVQENSSKGVSHCIVLAICLSEGFKMMSPITPFITEELSQHIPKFSFKENTLDSTFINDKLEIEVAEILNICTSIRQLNSQNNIVKKHEPKVYLFANSNEAFELLNEYKDIISTLSQISELFLFKDSDDIKKFNYVSTAGHLCSFGIKTNEIIVKSNDNSSINIKKLTRLENDLKKLMITISSEGYKRSVNETVQSKHLERIKHLELEISKIKGISS
ncbi:valine--tRNA ligase [Condylostylus longicornis]|uniref:valine--tRNA ligase n=1 Tax=Condylostylus longicornis TaxID=2530218 RepID=UPI00244DB907|nr:valine--tRNA ligase [Condylostylus longicornis]